jgi:hypothetical protein
MDTQQKDLQKVLAAEVSAGNIDIDKNPGQQPAGEHDQRHRFRQRQLCAENRLLPGAG